VEFLPFNRAHVAGRELEYMEQAVCNGHISGNGPFTKRCNEWLERVTGCTKALLTNSGTGALEMAAMLAEIKPRDEVIMPSFTFVSTANAFVLRGAVPVFVEIRGETLNLDDRAIEAAITRRTKAIVPIHYGGVACEMDAIMAIADAYGLIVIEDAAHALMARYRDRPLGTIGDLGAISFHETKPLTSGEGGALLIDDPRWVGRAEIIREKGANRDQFLRGEVDKYTWWDIGSSYSPSDLTAAFLLAQLEKAEDITAERVQIWRRYHQGFRELEAQGLVRRPVVPPYCVHNGHLYYLLLSGAAERDGLIEYLASRGVNAVFHYVPLHSSPAGRKYGRAAGPLPLTERASDALVRLPLWVGMRDAQVDRVIEEVHRGVEQTSRAAPHTSPREGSRLRWGLRAPGQTPPSRPSGSG
jgi:dTDP-4-amino-4,6-dideoxygalactose transaminase